MPIFSLHMIEINKLPPNKCKDYKALRLEALKRDPTAFGSSYEEERKLSEADWKKRTKNALFALSNNKPVGMIVYVFSNKIKTKHIANIFGVYTQEKYRNQGIGKKLIESALLEIRRNRSIMKIDLTVNPKQKSAVKLYKKYGFKVVGVLKKDLFVNGQFYDELVMEKFL